MDSQILSEKVWDCSAPAEGIDERCDSERLSLLVSNAMNPKTEAAVAVLKGKSLWNCGRAANMATFDFGERTKVIGPQGVKEVGEFKLHVQCSWRITRDDQIMVGSGDVYYPADYREGEILRPDFDWEREPNLRDKLVAQLFQSGAREFLVQEVVTGSAGSLRVGLSNGFALEIFPHYSQEGEHWRLFKSGQPHFVLSGRFLREKA